MSLDAFWTALVVPPVNLIPLTVAGVVVARRHARLGRGMTAIGAVGLLLLAMPLVSQALLVSLEQGLPLEPPRDAPPQAIVILAAELARGIGRDGQIVYLPGRLTLERLRAGAALARASGLPVLVSGGRPTRRSPPLAEVMAMSLRADFGVAPRWIESRSQDTWENAEDSAAILRAAGIGSVYLVTDAWHMPRALQAFTHSGLRATADPTRLDGWPMAALDGLVPETRALNDSYYALHEWIGRAYYAVRG